MRRLCALAFVWLGLAGCGASGGASTSATGRAHDTDSVDAEDTARTARRVEDILRGRIAGVRVIETPAGIAVRIRGAIESPYGGSGNSPLFVIDGLPLELGADGILDGLNPRDIQSIRVLKNASDTAFYGARGANGVVLITTVPPPPDPGDPDEGGDEGRSPEG